MLLTTTETATFLKISKSTLNKWRVYGSGPPYIKIGEAVRYEPSVLEAWISENSRRSTSQSNPKIHK